jgi:hypothetical protein
LRRVAEGAGLTLSSTRTVTASEWQYYQWRHALLFPAAGKRSAFWSPGQVPEPEQKFARVLIGLARRLHLQRWISRILDVLGQGDNFVFVLEKR